MIVVKAPRHKLLFLFTLSLVMVAASAGLAVGHWVPPLTELVGWCGILFFGLCGGWILAKLFSHRVSLILDREGLLDNSSALPVGRIPWDQITRVGIAEIEKQRFLGIDVRDRSVLATWAFRRWVGEVNVGLAGYPVYVPSTAIDRSLEEFHDLIARYWKDPKARTELDLHDPAFRKVWEGRMPTAWKFQLVIQIPIRSMGDFDRMVEAEERMIEALKDIADITGHDMGSGEGNIFIHTNAPERDVRIAFDCLEEHARDQAKAAYREIEGDKYVILRPAGLKEFRII